MDGPRSRRSRSIDIVARFGHLAAVRGAMLARDDLPATTRQGLVAKLSETLAGFVTAREWLDQDHARRIAKEACEKATVHARGGLLDSETPAAHPAPARERPADRRSGAGARSLSGNIDMFEEALAELSGLSLTRVSALVHARLKRRWSSACSPAARTRSSAISSR